MDFVDDLAPPLPTAFAALRDAAQPVVMFAYGSLIWDPEFCNAETEPALLRGYHRSFCLYSYDYRGSPGRPGLVLGLDRGGSCRGVMVRLAPEAFERVWLREMSGRRVYEIRLLPVRTASKIEHAFAFTVLHDSPDYAGRLSLDEAAHMILAGAGRRGTCREYFDNTLRHLEQLGLADRPLLRLAERVAALAVPQGTDGGI